MKTVRTLSGMMSTLPEKVAEYALEASYRRALVSILSLVDSVDDILDIGMVLVRPDALMSKRLGIAISYWSHLGLEVVGFVRTKLTDLEVHSVWRYQLNAATVDRIFLLECLFGSSESLVLILRKRIDRLRIPTSVLLSETKGASSPDERSGWELRARLGSPSRLRCYIHTPDEPIDVVRDLGILCRPRDCRRIGGMRNRVPYAQLGEVAERILESRVIGKKLPQDCVIEGSWPWALLDAGYDRWELFDRFADHASTMLEGTASLISSSGAAGWWEASPSDFTALREHATAWEVMSDYVF